MEEDQAPNIAAFYIYMLIESQITLPILIGFW